MIFLYQHKVSMKECHGSESAADLVHFSSGVIKATVLQCYTLHPIVQSKRCGIKGSSRPPALGHLLRVGRAVSTATDMNQAAAANMPTKQRYLSTHRQRRPENILPTDNLEGKISPLIAHFAPRQIQAFAPRTVPGLPNCCLRNM